MWRNHKEELGAPGLVIATVITTTVISIKEQEEEAEHSGGV